MMKRTWMAVVVVPLALGWSACTTSDGECWLKNEDGAGPGVGGGPIVPGQGGYGDVAPEPQGAPNPADPCSAESFECAVNWPKTCDAQGTNCVPTTTVYRCACASFADAKISCENALGVGKPSGPLSCGPCKAVTTADKTCTDMFEACQDKGMPCTRETSWGSTLCADCRVDCQAKKPYHTSECYQCGFE